MHVNLTSTVVTKSLGAAIEFLDEPFASAEPRVSTKKVVALGVIMALNLFERVARSSTHAKSQHTNTVPVSFALIEAKHEGSPVVIVRTVTAASKYPDGVDTPEYLTAIGPRGSGMNDLNRMITASLAKSASKKNMSAHIINLPQVPPK